MQFVNTIINYIYRRQKNCELSKEHTNKYYTRQQQFFAFKTTTKKKNSKNIQKSSAKK